MHRKEAAFTLLFVEMLRLIPVSWRRVRFRDLSKGQCFVIFRCVFMGLSTHEDDAENVDVH